MPPLSDEEYDKLIYGATGKRPEPVRQQGDIGEGENFARGVRKGFAGNPALAAQQYSGGAIPAPSWAKDPKFRGDRFEGMAGEALGTIGSAGAMMLGGEAAADAVPFFAARPLLTRGALGALSGAMSRPAQNPWELGAQAAGGAIAGGWRGAELAKFARDAKAFEAAKLQARTLAGAARRAERSSQYANQDYQAGMAQAMTPMRRAALRQQALDAADAAGLTRQEADQAIAALGKSPRGTWRWIMASPSHGLKHVLLRALAGSGGETVGRLPGAVGAGAGAYVGRGSEQQ